MTSLVSAAPGGASMPDTEIAGPPGCANGTGGRSNRSRSRPGWSLGGTICAPGGTTCATAANETLTIAKAAAMARTHASMPLTHLTNERKFYVTAPLGASAVSCPILAIFSDVSKRSHRLAATLQVAGCRVPDHSGAAAKSRRPLAVWCRCLSALVADRESGVENGCFRRPKGLIGTKAASAIALAMAPGWGDRRDTANL